MQIAKYRTIRGAQNYASELSATFPKRQFIVQAHPHDFAYTVRVMNAGQPVAYAGRRKGKPGRGIPMRNMRDFDKL